MRTPELLQEERTDPPPQKKIILLKQEKPCASARCFSLPGGGGGRGFHLAVLADRALNIPTFHPLVALSKYQWLVDANKAGR